MSEAQQISSGSTPTASIISNSSNSVSSIEEDWDAEVMKEESEQSKSEAGLGGVQRTLDSLNLSMTDKNGNDSYDTSIGVIEGDETNDSILRRSHHREGQSTPPDSPGLSTSSSTTSNYSASCSSTRNSSNDANTAFSGTDPLSSNLQNLSSKQMELKKKEREILRKIEQQKSSQGGGWKLTEGKKGELLKKEMGEWINSDPLPYETSSLKE